MNIEGNEERGQTLKSLRETAGFTQESLARDMEVSKALIGYYEAGKKLPRVDNFLSLARKLNVSLKTLASSMGLDITNIPDDLPPR